MPPPHHASAAGDLLSRSAVLPKSMHESSPPPDHPLRRPSKNALVLRGLLAAVLGIVLFWAILPRIAPWLLETVVVPRVAASLGASALRLQVRQADFGGVGLEALTLGDGLRASTAGVRWSVGGLLRGRLEAVRITGLRLVLQESEAGWSVPGISLPEAEDSAAPAFVPEVGAIQVEGTVEIRRESAATRIPISVSGSVDAHGVARLTTVLEPAGQPLHLAVHADIARAEMRVTAALPQASLAALAASIPGMPTIPLSGAAQAELRAATTPQNGPEIQATGSISSAQGVLGDMRFVQEGATSVDLRWQDEILFRATPFRLREPVMAAVTLERLRFSPHSGALECAWSMDVAPGPVSTEPLRIVGQAAGMRTSHGWEMNANATLAAATLRIGDAALALEASRMHLTARLDPHGAVLRAAFELGAAHIVQTNASLELSGMRITAMATPQSSGVVEGEVRITDGKIFARSRDAQMRSTHLAANATFRLGERPRVEALFSAACSGRSKDATAKLSLTLPVAWPTPAAAPGTLQAEVQWKKHALARLSARITQGPRGFDLGGRAELPLVGIHADLRGFLDFFSPEQTQLHVQADQTVVLPGRLARVFPALASLSGSARLNASAALQLGSGQPRIPARLAIAQCTLRHETAKMALENGTLDLAFADLATVRSMPRQRFSFQRLQLGSVELEAGEIHFQVEGPQSLFVERCDFRWAQGRVGTQSFRINPDVEDYTVELYCDRVRLAQALAQLGMPQVRGDGTANGRIPVHWTRGALSFDNGFLYSTPGENGVLQVDAGGMLTVGIPPDTPQFGQVDLAAEALKNFIYQWATVTMNTEGRELVVSLQLDGKPATPLPFVYDRDIGGFARVSASSPGSNFQGIRLDVNFRLPLDQLLHYKRLIKRIHSGG